ncbi:MAG: 4-hydroxy-tetrahydrodipicolinate synthase, partial [Planctomycetota bacterium]
MKRTALGGVYTALITPFTDDGDTVDLDRLAKHVHRQAAGGVRGVVPCGTTGEAPTLTDEEFDRVVATVLEAARVMSLQVIVGAGSNSTAHALKLHRHARQLGADAALHVVPYYNKPSQEGLYGHFSAIADACDLPIVLYNIPGRTGVGLTIETITRLARHPNIQAIKEATGSLQMASRILAATDLTVLSGDDPLTLPLLSIGAAGVVSVASNVVPDRVVAMCEAIDAGDLDGARRRHFELLPLADALLSLDTNPVPAKAAMSLLDLDTGVVRPPLAPATPPAVARRHQLLG